MENLNSRYEFILGFVGLAISLSAFKDELSQINIELGFIHFSLSAYFLIVLVGLLFSLYLYVIEKSFSNTKIGNYKIFGYLLKIANFIFVLIITSPVLVLVSWISYEIIRTLDRLDQESKSNFTLLIVSIMSATAIVISYRIVLKRILQRAEILLEKLEFEEIKEMEKASRLFKDKYYSHAILETFKVLEIHLYKLLQRRDIRVQRQRYRDILNLSLKFELISKQDLEIINEIRQMRNSAAHLDTSHTKEQAEKAVTFVKTLIQKNSKYSYDSSEKK